jgi:hypothetical protein
MVMEGGRSRGADDRFVQGVCGWLQRSHAPTQITFDVQRDESSSWFE